MCASEIRIVVLLCCVSGTSFAYLGAILVWMHDKDTSAEELLRFGVLTIVRYGKTLVRLKAAAAAREYKLVEDVPFQGPKSEQSPLTST
jgi:hypothetical protein